MKNWVRQQQRSCKGDSEKGRGREGGTAGGHGEHGMNGEGKEAEFKKSTVQQAARQKSGSVKQEHLL